MRPYVFPLHDRDIIKISVTGEIFKCLTVVLQDLLSKPIPVTRQDREDSLSSLAVTPQGDWFCAGALDNEEPLTQTEGLSKRASILGWSAS